MASPSEWTPGHTIMVSVESDVERRTLSYGKACDAVGPIELLIVQRHADGALGCLDSHLQMIALAKQRQWPSVLLLEDDVEFVAPFTVPPLPEQWHLLYLGGHIMDGQREGDLLRVRSTLTTHAYLVHARAYDLILGQNWYDHIPEWTVLRHDPYFRLQEPLSRSAWSPLQSKHHGWLAPKLDWSKRSIDVFLAHYVQTYPCYALYPLIAHQRPGYSGIEQGYSNYNTLFQWKASIAWCGGARAPMALLVVTTKPGPVAFATYQSRLPALAPHCTHFMVAWIQGEGCLNEGSFWGMPLSAIYQQVDTVDTLLVTRHAASWSHVDVSSQFVRQLILLPEWWDDNLSLQTGECWRDAHVFTGVLPLLPKGFSSVPPESPPTELPDVNPSMMGELLLRGSYFPHARVPPRFRPLCYMEGEARARLWQAFVDKHH